MMMKYFLLLLIFAGCARAQEQPLDVSLAFEVIPGTSTTVGTPLVFRITVTNTGSVAASGLRADSTLIEHLPEPFSGTCPFFDAVADGPGGEFAFAFRVEFGDLSPGTSKTCELTFRGSYEPGQTSFSVSAPPVADANPANSTQNITLSFLGVSMGIPAVTPAGLAVITALILLMALIKFRSRDTILLGLLMSVYVAQVSAEEDLGPELILSATRTKSLSSHELEVFDVVPNCKGLAPRFEIPNPPRTFTVTLPGRERQVARIISHDDGYHVIGKIRDQYDVIVNSNGVKMYAHIFGEREHYVIYPYGAGHRLAKIDSSKDERDVDIVRDLSMGAETHASKAALDGPVFIDVMVLFTPSAAAVVGSDDESMRLFSAHAVTVGNDVFMNSIVPDTYLRLSHWGQVNHVETGNAVNDLSWLQSDPQVAYLRNEAGADIVMLVQENLASYSGIANRQDVPGPSFAPYAFAIVKRQYAQDGLTFQHEFGHLLGMRHDPINDSGGTPSYPWSYGHSVVPDETHAGCFYTVMSYANGGTPPCYQIPYYSNASLTLSGDPVQGRPIGIPDQRENYRTAIAVAPVASQFRVRPPPLFGDGFE